MSQLNASKFKRGDQVRLQVESLAYGGAGIAKSGGLVYFVEDALPGESVFAEVLSVHKNFVKTKTIQVFQESPHRVKPFCAVYGKCGGCVFQHLEYSKQLEAKRQMLINHLQRIGGFKAVPVEPAIASPIVKYYRNQIRLHHRRSECVSHFGYFGRDNRTVLGISECPIADPRINKRLAELPQVLTQFEEEDMFRLQEAVLRVDDGPEAEVGLSFSDRPFLTSKERLEFQFCRKKFLFSMESFFQTNYSILPAMVKTVNEMLSAEGGEVLLDFYSGAGFFAVLFASQYGQVIGVEENERAVQDALANFQENAIHNAQMVAERAEIALEELKPLLKPPTHVILDPPRAGLQKKVIEFLNQQAFERLIYISCEPSLLARDLKGLASSYWIERVVPLDMFPQTQHIETLVLLRPVRR